ncbi:multidrug effflux MFS transporter [Mycolicibacterium phlei]|jgi:DHA1 family bicyclomycin/chloramphenicol resistance-like MFS transporter|uniref:multidrug effflux MFS transporter n=1 Tax=Mycolicibacterium phlei TaxID=1771 RepID=UPI00025ADAF1|nr:multidrug effflux MFS transporter [Mycolicibacterium phlei]EID17629.1 Bcr/CflA subfamily drug resistance transporter [Mycolicibacterium phlei RIVM601174]MBF4193647.1 Bcr/CflA subfamily drug resistance transporter [Mycolicibacterium phlei]
MTAHTPTKPIPALLICVLALLNAVTPLSIDMYLSAFPQMADEFGTTPSAVQLSLTTFLVGLAVGQLVIGSLSDQFGRRRPLIIGSIACLVISALCVVAPGIEALVALRFAQGFTGAAGVVISRAIIADRAHGAAAARLFAVMMLISVLAPILGPMAGGAIVVGFGWRAVFVALAIVNLLMVAGVVCCVDESLPPDRRRPGGLRALATSARSVLGNRYYIGYTLTMAFAAAGMFAYISASPFVLQNIIGLSPQAYAFTFGACALAVGVSSAISARIVGRFGPRRVLKFGVTAMTVVGALQLLDVTVGGVIPWATIALNAGFMASLGFVYSNATSLAVTEVRHAAGSGSAVLGFLQYGAGAVTPPLVGLAGSANAVPMGVAMFTAAVAAALAVFVLTRGHVPADSRAETSAAQTVPAAQ